MSFLAGLKEEVKIEVKDDGVLQVSGEHTKEEQKSGKWQRIERAHGKVLRPFRFPENAKVEQVRVTTY